MANRRIIPVILIALLLASTFSFLTNYRSLTLNVTGEAYDGRYTGHYPLFISPIPKESLSLDDVAADQSTRMNILTFVESNPGSHFRLICSSLDLGIGVVQYHVQRLEEDGLVSSKQFGRYRRFYQSKMYDSTCMAIISMLSIETVRKIVIVLLDEGSVRHGVLAERIGVSSQALSWHMKRLSEAELVSSKVEEGLRYSINVDSQELIARCLEILNT